MKGKIFVLCMMTGCSIFDSSIDRPPEPLVNSDVGDQSDAVSEPDTSKDATKDLATDSTPDIPDIRDFKDSGNDLPDTNMADAKLDMSNSQEIWIGAGQGFSYSYDGNTWNTIGVIEQGDAINLSDIAFADGVFIAVADYRNSPFLIRSTDGVTWSDNLTAGREDWLGGVDKGGDRWVAAGGNGRSYYSTDDGLQWFDGPTISQPVRALHHANGKFMAVGDQGFLSTSTDGLIWNDVAVPTTSDLGTIGFSGGVWIVGSRTSAMDGCITSTDAVNWTTCTFASNVSGFIDNNGQAAVTHDGGLSVWNGSDWDTQAGVYAPTSFFPSFFDGSRWVGGRSNSRYTGASVSMFLRTDNFPEIGKMVYATIP